MMLVRLATSNDLTDDGTTLAETTFRRLLRLITSGEVPPGSDLSEEKLAVDLDVSRTPLRDAIRRLELLGLLHRRSNRTLMVPRLSYEEMEDLSLTREALETLVVRRAAQRVGCSEADGSRLEEIHARTKRLAKLKEDRFSLEAGLALHRELSRLASLPSAVSLLDQVVVRLERYRQLVKGNAARIREILAEHEAILNAVLKGDDLAAEAAMRQHLRNARNTYAKHPKIRET
jgi:DNA-binding GntR family transcriptional regulator